ncbi:MAG: hypothetical protein CMH85_03575 [Novosphingobium sp.]|uniref:DUF937 domain-containing protein n=1 Tax=Novosphingobium indicum TaxID=462949 RepID=A0ABQ2JK47_9SPHN|nr:hypothetical protein [Novosphingobium indicum]MAC57356.1 hypothetical protein [Novosphingobium sp.]GGN47949.1 hypothetical protein GCM10011349_16930 [Novosphingobium indicum]|tara:strand:- start:695 stop:1048 length:354 start_codon:yes stop_codon:yes gene_type:complete
MGLFDGILGQVSEHADVGNLASQLGIDPAMAEKAIAALGIAHQQEGDTAQLAAKKTGIDLALIQQIIAAIGGEGSLSQFANQIASDPSQITKLLDRDGDGSAVDDLTDMAKGFFGKS